jgi:hypothetical protein
MTLINALDYDAPELTRAVVGLIILAKRVNL